MSVSIYVIQYPAPTKKAPDYWHPMFILYTGRKEAIEGMRELKRVLPGRYRVCRYLPAISAPYSRS